MDFKSAFNSRDHQSLLYKLSVIGLSSKNVNTIQNIESSVWINDNIFSFFPILVDLRQGDVLSVLF